jgi:protein ImuA
MTPGKKDIFQQLQKEILCRQGFTPMVGELLIDSRLGAMVNAFPNKTFPAGAVHEFLSAVPEAAAATSGFISGLLSGLMQGNKACVWISRARQLFPPAMKAFGVAPDQIIFIDLQREKDILWVMEEALKCPGLAVVVAEIQEISFTASRRLQLAVEKSRVTGFLLRQNPPGLHTLACVARWKITAIPSEPGEGLPGIGFPRWKVELLKIRNGRPGAWQIEWSDGRFQAVYPLAPTVPAEQRRQTG